jgi:hypothetical protein
VGRLSPASQKVFNKTDRRVDSDSETASGSWSAPCRFVHTPRYGEGDDGIKIEHKARKEKENRIIPECESD